MASGGLRGYGLPVMHRRLLVSSLVALCSLSFVACDKGGEKKADKKAEAAKDDKKAETKKADDKPETAGPEKPEAKHFDVSADKSGTLARNAAVLETTDSTSEDTALREHLAELSHHAEQISSDETLCKHMMAIREGKGEAAGTLDSCVMHFEHQVVILGPEVFAQMAQCIMDTKTVEDIEVCEAAEQEAEALLHEQKHGDGLSEEVCTQFFDKFEALSMADVGEDHAQHIKEVLEGVREDSVKACQDQGTQAEIDCAMKAENMDALTECQEIL